MKAYVTRLTEYANKYGIAVHASALMTNHVHILCTPVNNSSAILQMMQSLWRMYLIY